MIPDPEPEQIPNAIVRFSGDGSVFVQGVPTRDMSAQEWLELPDALKEAAIETGMYYAETEPTEEGE
jgi:hypothetical protein